MILSKIIKLLAITLYLRQVTGQESLVDENDDLETAESSFFQQLTSRADRRGQEVVTGTFR